MESTVHIGVYDALKADNVLIHQRATAADKRADTAEKEARMYREKMLVFEHELAQLKRMIFGVRSERFEGVLDSSQIPLFEGAPSVEVAPVISEPITYTRKKKKPVRQALPSHLPREVIVIEPDVDTTGLKKIGVEVTETLDYRAARLVVIRRERPKYVAVDDRGREARGVIIAELPPRPIEKGMAEPSLLAHVVIEKYADHLPLYRQVQRFTRAGITLAESTLGDWIMASARLLAPLYEAMKEELLDSGYIQADETPIQVQDPNKGRKTHRGYYWVYHAPEKRLIVMDYQRSRSRAGPTNFLQDYEGALQSDGYSVYDVYDQYPHITTYNCMAHARRYFFDAQDNAPELAAHALREIGRLYDIERELREQGSSPEDRKRMRQERALPILKRFKSWLGENPGLPRSPWGKAVHYSLARWDKLTRYIEDGRIEIDNNLTENVIRPIAIGRKNYLFAGSHNAAQRAAVIYSLLATCKKHDVNPYEWLTDVLGRIPTHPAKRVHELLPHRWVKVKV